MSRKFVLIVEVDEGSANEQVMDNLPSLGEGMRLRAMEMPNQSTLLYRMNDAVPLALTAVPEEGMALSEWKPSWRTRTAQWLRRVWNRVVGIS